MRLLLERPKQLAAAKKACFPLDYGGPRFGWKLSRLLPYPVWLARALPFFIFYFFSCHGGSSAATVDAARSTCIMQTWMEC